jgi:hypothetical protein
VGLPPKSEYSSRLGDPLPTFEILPVVELLTSACVTVAGDAPGFVCR